SFEETAGRGTMTMGSDGDVDQIAKKLIAMFRSAQFQAYMRSEEAKYARPRSLDFSLDPPEEGQDPAWSYSMQKKLERFFAEHAVADQFNVTSVDCRTTYCEIKAEGKPDEESLRAFDQVAADMIQLGWGLIVGGGGSGPNRDGTLYEMHQVFRRDPRE
ncbi:MAG: hypothetical protein ACJ8OJ_09430, partial [Povalibacter sp.]